MCRSAVDVMYGGNTGTGVNWISITLLVAVSKRWLFSSFFLKSSLSVVFQTLIPYRSTLFGASKYSSCPSIQFNTSAKAIESVCLKKCFFFFAQSIVSTLPCPNHFLLLFHGQTLRRSRVKTPLPTVTSPPQTSLRSSRCDQPGSYLKIFPFCVSIAHHSSCFWKYRKVA